MSTQKAALLRLREKALSGDSRALDRLLLFAENHNNDELPAVGSVSANDRLILKIFTQRVLSRAVGPYDTAADDES